MTLRRPRFTPLSPLPWACIAVLVLTGGLSAVPSASAAEAVRKVEGFTLPDMHGRDRSLDESGRQEARRGGVSGSRLPAGPALCPAVAGAERRVRQAGRGVHRHRRQPARFADRYDGVRPAARLKFPLLKDRDQAVADKFGVERNPEVFVLDRDRKIRYRGRIDDQYGQGSSSGYAKTKVNSPRPGRSARRAARR